MPFCTVGQTLKDIDKASKICYSKLYFPFISDREIYLHGVGINRLQKTNKMLIVCNSIDED